VDPLLSGEPVRVLVVEDHAGFRAVLRALLESDERLIVIDDVGSAGELLEHRHLDDVDVVLMDIGLPGANGIDATRMLREQNPSVRVLIMSGSGFDRAADDALAAGAVAYLEKGALHEELIDAIVEAGTRGRARV